MEPWARIGGPKEAARPSRCPPPMQNLLPLGALALVSGLASAQDKESFQPFVERPGELEFSGVLCARPLQLQEALEQGLSRAQAEARYQEALALLEGLSIDRWVEATDEYLIQLGPGARENDVARQLLGSGAFQYVEPDWICYPVDCPNDSQFGGQWQHVNMESCDGWDLETGDPNIVVAICDTGIQVGHPDLQLHRREGYNAPSQTWENSGGDITPVHPHGTMVTGCAAANGDNGIGVAGVGWNLGHRMMRVTNDSGGGASLSNLTNAARTAVEAGDKVSNVSYSGVASGSVQTTGDYIRSLGSLLVWSGGNSSENHQFSRDDSVIIVGASDSSDNKTSWSAFGPGVDFLAPGAGVLTTNTGGTYSSVSGTSFSAPITAGLIGLIWSADPSLSPQEVEDILRATCDDLGSPGVDDTHGYGRINVRKAMDEALRPIRLTLLDTPPTSIDPAGGESVAFLLEPGTSTPASGSGQFWINMGAGWSQAPCVETSPNQYLATFPATPCGSTVQYYFRGEDATGAPLYEPAEAPATFFTAESQILVNVADDAFEAASGWTAGMPGDDATTGVWERGDPIGTAAQPENDNTVAGTQCFFTGQGSNGGSLGENDVDGGSTTLMSPSYDLTGLGNPTISYYRWYSNGTGASPNADVFVVDISNNGGASWTNVETVGPTGDVNGGWIQHSFAVTDFVALTGDVRLRFIASDLGSGSIVEAGIDDLRIDDEACSDCGITPYCTSINNSTGTFAKIGWNGTSSIANNDFEMTATDLPTGQNGVFIQSLDPASTVVGDGVLCVGAQTLGFIHRLGVVNTGPAGAVSFSFDNTAPSLPSVQVAAGDTWYFQFWYRDPALGLTGHNFSDALRVTFCP